jgi:hypothetical protein
VSKHEDVLRRFFADLGLRVAPWHREALDAVLAEVESLRAERDEASRALSGVLEAADASRMVLIEQVKSAVARIEALQTERGKARDAAISLAAKLSEAETGWAQDKIRWSAALTAAELRLTRLEAALREIAEEAVEVEARDLRRMAQKALAPSAPEPERQVTRRCRHCGEPNGWQDGDILTLEAHADCIAKAHTPAPAPTERVCRCVNAAGPACEEYVEREGYQGCFVCGHDRACHTGEQR